MCRFMKNWKRQSPSSYCFLRYDKLYIDNRLFVWDKERQDVVEQGEVPGGPPAVSRWGHRYRYNIKYLLVPLSPVLCRPGSSASRVWSRPSSSLTR